MSIICCECGSTYVSCEVIINPNTKDFFQYEDDPFDYGLCAACGKETDFTDTEKVKLGIDNALNDFKSVHKTEPLYAKCRVIINDYNGPSENAIIKLSSDKCGNDKEIFFHCKDIEELKSFAEFSEKGFIIIEFISFNENKSEISW